MENHNTIKINFIGFWSNFDKNDNFFTNILKKRFKVIISDQPDFLFVSALCGSYEYMKYDCVRILYSGEPLHPDFNVFDYAIGFDNIVFDDRYIQFPYFLLNKEKAKSCIPVSFEEANEILKQKELFCNFIYSHESPNGERNHFLELLQKYKRVECAGTYKNNMENNWAVRYTIDKIDFIRKCKFTIAFESFSHKNFLTEKIRDAFVGNSVPVYFGDSNVGSVFNEKAFINCNSFSSLDEVIDKVIEIDRDDDKFIEMLVTPKYVQDDYVEHKYSELEAFLFNIFEQNPRNAFRRYKQFAAKHHENCLEEYRRIRENKFKYKIIKSIIK